MIEAGKVRAALKKLSGKKVHAKFFRIVLEDDSVSMLEIWPSQMHGWRFNPKGEFGALYLSDDPENCLKEIFKHIPDARAFFGKNRVKGTVRVKVQWCLDLTDSQVLRALNIDEVRILSDDSEEAIIIAREARGLGFEGILYRSSVDKQRVNFALFKDCMRPASRCVLEKAEKISEHEIKKVLS